MVILHTRTHQLMDEFVQMGRNSNKMGYDKGINTKEKDIHENYETKNFSA